MVRPELVDSRKRVRRDSDNLLENIQLSSYAPMEKIFFGDILSGVGASGVLKSSIPDNSLTGSLQAVLPLTITMPNSDNSKRLSFSLLINPGTWNQGKLSSTQSSYTRKGFVTQLWGPQQDTISCTGKTAAFVVEGIGLTNVARRRSSSYVNFLAFLSSYRNNGYELIDPVSLKGALTRVIRKVHGVELYYDSQNFMGHFNSFTINEDADRPFLFDFSFDFIISSLSDDYNEVRGHFEPITKETFKSTTKETENFDFNEILLGDIA